MTPIAAVQIRSGRYELAAQQVAPRLTVTRPVSQETSSLVTSTSLADIDNTHSHPLERAAPARRPATASTTLMREGGAASAEYLKVALAAYAAGGKQGGTGIAGLNHGPDVVRARGAVAWAS